MKVIFLDFDGVLNSGNYFNYAIRTNPDQEITEIDKMKHMLDPVAIKKLNAIIQQTDAKVVISSSWRDDRPLDEWRQMLELQGFQGEIIGITPNFGETDTGKKTGHGRRYEQIQAWLNAHDNVDGFVIIDDIIFMAYLSNHAVMTTYERGLEDKHIEEAVNMLKLGLYD